MEETAVVAVVDKDVNGVHFRGRGRYYAWHEGPSFRWEIVWEFLGGEGPSVEAIQRVVDAIKNGRLRPLPVYLNGDYYVSLIPECFQVTHTNQEKVLFDVKEYRLWWEEGDEDSKEEAASNEVIAEHIYPDLYVGPHEKPCAECGRLVRWMHQWGDWLLGLIRETDYAGHVFDLAGWISKDGKVYCWKDAFKGQEENT